jgi:hypothetical protein
MKLVHKVRGQSHKLFTAVNYNCRKIRCLACYIQAGVWLVAVTFSRTTIIYSRKLFIRLTVGHEPFLMVPSNPYNE